jgi:hypothetical protein
MLVTAPICDRDHVHLLPLRTQTRGGPIAPSQEGRPSLNYTRRTSIKTQGPTRIKVSSDLALHYRGYG